MTALVWHDKKFAYAFFAGAIVLPVFIFISTLRSYRRYPQKLVEKRSKEEIEQAVSIEITNEGISLQSEDSNGFCKWSAIPKIIEFPDYLYVYVSSTTALIVPRRELGDAQFQAFKDELARYKPLASPLAKDDG